jgi:hypothetical protein
MSAPAGLVKEKGPIPEADQALVGRTREAGRNGGTRRLPLGSLRCARATPDRKREKMLFCRLPAGLPPVAQDGEAKNRMCFRNLFPVARFSGRVQNLFRKAFDTPMNASV